MNWKARFRNPVFLTALISGILLILKSLGIINLNDDIDKLTNIVITIAVGLGICVDPSTPGISDK